MENYNKNSNSNENSTTKAHAQHNMMKRNSLMGDELDHFDASELELDDDDWRDVFDDDAPADNVFPSETALMPPPADKKKESGSSSSSSRSSSSRRRRSASATPFELELETADEEGAPPPLWHSAAADLPLRQVMIQDIAQLLFARKKDNPGTKWMERLPIKARMLETQLYKNAESLEAYLDRTTLKIRLGKLASAITSHYQQAIQSRRRRSSTRSSTSSVMSGSSLGSLENKFSNAKLRRSSVESLPGSSALAAAAAGTTKLRREQSDSAILLNSSSSSITDSFPTTKLRPEQSDTTVVPSANNTNTSSNNASAAAPLHGSGSTQKQNTNTNTPGAASANNINPIAQQRPTNEQLQQHILANIRQQQNIASQLNGNGQQPNNNQMMAAQAAMMGGNNGMAMLNQLQQQNAMNMNLMQQQQQQQQQQQNRQGAGIQNMTLFQQQQNNPSAPMFMGNVNIPIPNNNGMSMVNFPLPNVIPGVGAGNFQNFNNGNNNTMMARDNTSMPPPSTLTNVANTPPRTPTGGNEEGSQLSPNSFRW